MTGTAAGGFLRPLRRPLRPRPGTRLRLRGDRQDRRAAARPARGPGPGAAAPTTSSWSTSTRTPTRRRKNCCTRWPATAASSSSSATPISPSTASAALTPARSCASPIGSARPDGQPAQVIALRTCRRSGPVLLAASRRVARRLPGALGAQATERRSAGIASWPPLARGRSWHGAGDHRRQRYPGSRGDRRHASPRPPDGRRELVINGGAGALGHPAGATAAARPGCGGSSGDRRR